MDSLGEFTTVTISQYESEVDYSRFNLLTAGRWYIRDESDYVLAVL